MQAGQDADHGVRRSLQQVPPQAARARVARIGPDLGERLEHEPPFVHPRVGDDQRVELDDGVAVEEHVEVDHAVRPVPSRPPPEAALEISQRAEEIERGPRGAEADDGVVEALRRDAADGGRGEDPAGHEVRAEVAQPGDGEVERARAIAEGGAQGDGNVRHGRAWRYTPIALSR